jgi:opacity protein-like surface antigen
MKKNSLDELFQKAFKNFEVTPDDSNWDAIKSNLEERQKKNVLAFWYKVSGFAALLAIIISSGYFLGDKSPALEPGVSNSEPEEKINTDQKPEKDFKNLNKNVFPVQSTDSALVGTSSKGKVEINNSAVPKSNNSTEKTRGGNAVKFKNKPTREASATVAMAKSKTAVQAENSFQSKSITENSNNKVEAKPQAWNKAQSIAEASQTSEQIDVKSPGSFSKSENEALEQKTKFNLGSIDSLNANSSNPKKSLLAIAEEKEENEKALKEKSDTTAQSLAWSLRPTVSPILYNGLSGGNSIDARFQRNKSKGDFSFSYGINVAYAVSDRIKIRSGLNKVNMSYNTENIKFSSAVNAMELSGIEINSKNKNIEVLSGEKDLIQNSESSRIAQGDMSSSGFKDGNINQQMGFIEVPLEIEYALIDKRFNLNIIGGASTFFLNENRVQIESDFGRTQLGKSSKLNNTSFSANFGLGLNYAITEQFDLNLEPTFKYQMNTFNGADNFKPYFLGVYTGISFNF